MNDSLRFARIVQRVVFRPFRKVEVGLELLVEVCLHILAVEELHYEGVRVGS